MSWLNNKKLTWSKGLTFLLPRVLWRRKVTKQSLASQLSRFCKNLASLLSKQTFKILSKIYICIHNSLY